MVSKEDWDAAMSSEIFREYCKNEMSKEAQPSEEEKFLKQFDALEQKIQSNAKLRKQFKQLQVKFASDENFKNTVDSRLVEGIMVLDLDGEYDV